MTGVERPHKEKGEGAYSRPIPNSAPCGSLPRGGHSVSAPDARLTGARRNEVSTNGWTEIDEDSGVDAAEGALEERS